MVKTKKKEKPVDIANIVRLIEEANVTYYMIEKECKLGKAIVSRGVKENSLRPIPPRHELKIIKYLKKKIAERKLIEMETIQVYDELGVKIPETESGLPINEKEIKREWYQKLSQ